MRRASRLLALGVVLALGVGLALAGCASPQNGLTVEASTCVLSSDRVASGPFTIHVENSGDEVAAFEFQSDAGTLAGLDNLAPGSSRALIVSAGKGTYIASCTPATAAEAITRPFTVLGGSKVEAYSKAAKEKAVENYRAYLADESSKLVTATEDFARSYAAGDAILEWDAEGNATQDDFDTYGALVRSYFSARAHWIALRPVSAAFADLIPAIDAREGDLVEGETWTGWHRIESDMEAHEPLGFEERVALADKLVSDTKAAVARLDGFEVTTSIIAAGAVDLVDYALQSDFEEVQASVAAARSAFDALLPLPDGVFAWQVTTRFEDAETLSSAKNRIASLDALADSLSRLEAVVS